MTVRAQRRTGHKAATEPEVIPWRRPERNPLFRGWCYLCGAPIYPSSRNWYCRVCAHIASAAGAY